MIELESDTIKLSTNLNGVEVYDSILLKNDSILQLLANGQNEILSSISNSGESRIIEFISNDLFWTIIGGIIGIALSFLFWMGNRIRESITYKNRYGRYGGFYVSKIASNLNEPHYIVKLDRKRNEFKIKGVSVKIVNGKLEKRHENIQGHIKMGNVSEIFGIGQYQHEPEEDGKIRSGEYRIQLAPNRKIIVIQHIIDNDLNQSIPKYIWEPLDEKEGKEYIDFYKSLIK